MVGEEGKMRKLINNDKLFTVFNYLLATLFLVIAFYPLWYVVICSFSDPTAVVTGKVWITPAEITLAGYERMFAETEIWYGYARTIAYTVVGTCINLLFTIPAGYALTRKTLPFRKAINIYFMLTMFIGGGLIPTYLWMSKLGLVDNVLVLVLMGAVNVWNMIICRTFFDSNIPAELIDAAKIDGGSETRIFTTIVIPLSKALLAVMMLFFAVGHWNSYFTAMVYMRSNSKWPLQLVLRQLLLTVNNVDEGTGSSMDRMMQLQGMKYAVVIAASVPVLVVYPFIQKHFVKGIMIGAVKG